MHPNADVIVVGELVVVQVLKYKSGKLHFREHRTGVLARH